MEHTNNDKNWTYQQYFYFMDYMNKCKLILLKWEIVLP